MNTQKEKEETWRFNLHFCRKEQTVCVCVGKKRERHWANLLFIPKGMLPSPQIFLFLFYMYAYYYFLIFGGVCLFVVYLWENGFGITPTISQEF